jgi:hypothetical protein
MNKLFSYLHTKSREEKFRLFVKLLNPTPSVHILTVGASGPNFAFAEQFESLYQHPNQVTGGGISLSEVQDYRRSFPRREDTGLRLVRSLGRTPYGNLNLLTKRQLQRLLPEGGVVGCRVTFYSETLIAYRRP